MCVLVQPYVLATFLNLWTGLFFHQQLFASFTQAAEPTSYVAWKGPESGPTFHLWKCVILIWHHALNRWHSCSHVAQKKWCPKKKRKGATNKFWRRQEIHQGYCQGQIQIWSSSWPFGNHVDFHHAWEQDHGDGTRPSFSFYSLSFVFYNHCWWPSYAYYSFLFYKHGRWPGCACHTFLFQLQGCQPFWSIWCSSWTTWGWRARVAAASKSWTETYCKTVWLWNYFWCPWPRNLIQQCRWWIVKKMLQHVSASNLFGSALNLL